MSISQKISLWRHLETLHKVAVVGGYTKESTCNFILTSPDNSSQSNGNDDFTVESRNDGHLRFGKWRMKVITFWSSQWYDTNDYYWCYSDVTSAGCGIRVTPICSFWCLCPFLLATDNYILRTKISLLYLFFNLWITLYYPASFEHDCWFLKNKYYFTIFWFVLFFFVYHISIFIAKKGNRQSLARYC